MRDIKFRGKRIDNGAWIIGDLLHCKGEDACRVFIKTDTGLFEVDPATVGQFTGLLDRNGGEIYDGDIINWLSIKPGGVGYVEQGHIEWRQIEGCYVVINRFDTTDHRELIYQLMRCTRDITVVSNIHDNPELLTE